MDGIFSVGSGSTVKFSRGNLQYQANSNTWQFASHQYDMIGADNSNISSSYSGWIDLFGWATNGNDGNGTHYQPWDSSTDDTYGNIVAQWGSSDLPFASDWASNIGTDWRTLSSAEWTYLLNTRTTTATIAGIADARYALAQLSISGNTICGLILFPDNYDGIAPAGVTWSSAAINSSNNSFSNCTVTSEGWEVLEEAGCVFLPCAGYRDGASVNSVGLSGFYWSATTNSTTNVYALNIPLGWNALFGYARHRGHSVRLVHVVE